MILCIRLGVKVCSKCTLYFFGGVHSKKFFSGTLFWAKKDYQSCSQGYMRKNCKQVPRFLIKCGVF